MKRIWNSLYFLHEQARCLSQWQAILYPLLLTALLYLGPLVMAALDSTLYSDEIEDEEKVGFIQEFYTKITTDIFLWRNYVVVRHQNIYFH